MRNISLTVAAVLAATSVPAFAQTTGTTTSGALSGRTTPATDAQGGAMQSGAMQSGAMGSGAMQSDAMGSGTMQSGAMSTAPATDGTATKGTAATSTTAKKPHTMAKHRKPTPKPTTTSGM